MFIEIPMFQPQKSAIYSVMTANSTFSSTHQIIDSTNPFPLNSRELLILDPSVDHIQQLIDGLKPGIDWVVLNPNQDGIEQITRILANYPEITTLHLVSHGAPGCLFLGNTQLNLDTLEDYTTQLQSWFASSPPSPQIWGSQESNSASVQTPLLFKVPMIGDLGARDLQPPSPQIWGSQESHVSLSPNPQVWGEQVSKSPIIQSSSSIKAPTYKSPHYWGFGGRDLGGKGDLQPPSHQNWGSKDLQPPSPQIWGSTGDLAGKQPSILLYGCNVAAGDAGEEFIHKLHNITQANIAASQTLTGNSQQGGNWNLETTLGNVKAEQAFLPETQAAYASVLSRKVDFNVSSVFDEDGIINKGSSGTDSLQNGLDDIGMNLITQSYAGPGQQGLPDNGFFSGKYGGPDIQLQYRNSDNGYNLRQITNDTSDKKFSFSVQQNFYSEVHIAGFSTQGSTDVRLTFTYTDGSSRNTNYTTLPDWFDDISEDSSLYYLIDGMDRAGGSESLDDVNAVALFGLKFNNPDPSKTVSKITVERTSNDSGYLSFLGATGVIQEFSPNDISLNNTSIAENSENGVLVGTLSTTDKNTSDSHSYTLLNDAGGRFKISGNQIFVENGSLLDFEDATSHTIQVRTTDSTGRSYDESFTINLTNVNEVPTNISVDNSNVDENATDGTVIATLSTTDPDSVDSHTYTLVNDAAGRFGISGNQIVVADGSLLDFETNSSHTIRVSTTDSGGLTDEKDIVISINNINEAPEIADQPFSVAENASNGTKVGTVTSSDVDGPTRAYSITDRNDNGIFKINQISGDITVADDSLLDFETTKSYDLTVEVSDGDNKPTATVTVSITDANDAPEIEDQSLTLAENATNSSLVGTVTVNDADGDNLTYQITAGNNDGIFEIDENTGEITLADSSQIDFETTESYDLTVKVDDDEDQASATVTVDITDINEVPEITSTAPTSSTQDSAYSYNITVADPDAGETLTITAPTLPNWLTLTDNGDGTATLSGTPGNAEVGDHAIELKVEDSEGEVDTQSFTVKVKNTNDAPTIAGTPDTTIDEDSSYSFVPTAEDIDGDVLSFSIENKPDWVTFDSATGELSGTPENADVGTTDNIIISVSDGTETVELDPFSLEVINTNDVPEITSTAPLTATQSSTYTYNLVVNDPDIGDNLTITASTLPDWLTLTNTGNGTATLSGVPSDAEVGDHTIELKVEDTAGEIDTQSFTLKVKNTNDAPTITGTPNTTVDEDSSYSFIPTADDLDGDSLSFSIQNKPTWSLFDSATGELSGTPENADVGTTENIIISVSDGTATVDLDTFSIEVVNTNDAPEITTVAPTNTAQNSRYTYKVEVNDPDIGDNLTITAPTLPVWLTLSDAPTPTSAVWCRLLRHSEECVELP